MREIERRFLSADTCELRAAGGDDAPVIEGYAARFGVLSDDLGFGREKIRAGAFKRTLDNGSDVVGLWQHRDDYLLARSSTGTLDLEEDDTGLLFRMRPVDTSYSRDLMALIRSGEVKDMSFGFQTITDEWSTEEGETVREIIEAHLFDVSAVTNPAYPQTSIAVRSLLAHEGAKDDEIQAIAARIEFATDTNLTAKELRSILDPIVCELRTHRSGPGPASHPEQVQRRTDSVRRRLDLIELSSD